MPTAHAPAAATRASLEWVALGVGCLAFFVFSYNSGYGYDALEHLVIGRSLLDGYALYDFVPSRSFGIYVLVAAFLGATGLDGHFGTSLLVTAIFAAFVLTTRIVVARQLDRTTGVIAAALVAASAAFMEMNFLLSEGPMLVLALVGYDVLLREETRGERVGFRSGLWLGAGLVFKSVAAFYVAAACLWLVARRVRVARTLRLAQLAPAVRVGLGATAWIAVPALYFAARGKLAEHVQWTYVFPLLHFPANTVFLEKLLIKASWFWLALAAALVAPLASKRLRTQVYSAPAATLALAMGAAACLALRKQQASHYLFPGAGLLVIYIAHVARLALGRCALGGRAILLSVGAAVVLVASVLAYRPTAFERFTTLRDYGAERALAATLRELVPEGRHALFFEDSLRLYWLSRRYPNTSFLKIDVQEAHLLQRAPELVERALADESVVLVSLRQGSLGVDDGRAQTGSSLDARIHAAVKARFTQLPSTRVRVPHTLWIRAPHAPR